MTGEAPSGAAPSGDAPSSGAPSSGSPLVIERSGALRRTLSFTLRHRIGLARALVLGLLAIAVMQNVEPVTIQLWFWSLPEVPMLVLILAAMGLGAVLWEFVRRFFGSSD